MTPQEIQSSLEAIIYAADEPATLDQISKALGIEKPEARAALEQLTAAYQTDDRGIEVRKVAGGWKFYTKAQHHDVVRKFIKSLQPPLRLTMPALETLAVIAYKQPVTVPEINEIRGVHVGGVIKTLLEKRLITTAGRKEVIGRPILYRTSKQFMMRFGLSDLDELPSLKEFEALAQAALGSDEGIAEVQPEDQTEGQPQGQAQAAQVEPAAAAAVKEAASANEPRSQSADTPAQSVTEALADSPETHATETAQTSAEEKDKSRAAAASSTQQTNEPSV
jgi:segregation and condensation protein B